MPNSPFDEYKSFFTIDDSFVKDCTGNLTYATSTTTGYPASISESLTTSIPAYYLKQLDVGGDTDGDIPGTSYSLDVDRVVKNGPALIVFWADGTKTIVKRKKGEKDEPYHAFCAALAKKIYGSNSQIKKIVDNIQDETKKKSKK